MQYIHGDQKLFWNAKASLTLLLFSKVHLKKSSGLLAVASQWIFSSSFISTNVVKVFSEILNMFAIIYLLTTQFDAEKHFCNQHYSS